MNDNDRYDPITLEIIQSSLQAAAELLTRCLLPCAAQP